MSSGEPSQEQRLTVRELAQELEKFRQILETASDGFVTINQNHEVVYMNRAAERIFGFARQEVLGGDLDVLLPQEYRGRHRHFVERYVRTRQPRVLNHRIEVDATRRDGTRFPAAVRFSAAEVGDSLLFTARIRDMSQERDLAAKVRHSEQLALVGQMVATVTHEIRTPLALIGGFANQLLKERGLRDKSRHKLSVIVEEVARLESILKELNDLSRPQKLDWQLVDLRDVVARVVELMEPRLKQDRIRLTVDQPAEFSQVMADPNHLNQVLINLLNNALQASQAGSRLEVTLWEDPEGAYLEVRDHGCGIKPEDRDQVMQPFFTTKKGGTGLGLPVASRIMEEHGGQLELFSEPGRGTTVRLSLPLATTGSGPEGQPQA